MNNEEMQFSNQFNIQWFPGHMARTLRVMEQEIQHVDASLILLDARIPLSSLNPEIERITARKPRLYALNKADLADPSVTEEWIRYFRSADAGCVAINAKSKGGTAAVRSAIEKELSCPVSIGYGTGTSLAQARLNALNASLESVQKGVGSYLINEKDQLIGPLGAGTGQPVMVVGGDLPSDLKSSLSPLTVRKIYAAFCTSEKKELTARELSVLLGITKRSANRFLTVLAQEGWLKVAYKTRSTTKGRPEGVYVWTGDPASGADADQGKA